MNYIREYWEKIQSGEELVSIKVRQQMELLINDLDNPKSYSITDDRGNIMDYDFVFDEERGLRPIEFMETFCKHSKAPWTGKLMELELWQKARIQAAYGFINKNTGYRQYREVITWVARKNGKTTESSGLAAYNLVADGEGGAEVYSAASKKDQARKAFGETWNMVAQDHDLASIITKRKSDLYHPGSFSEYKPLASDADTLDGLNASFVIGDELHAWKTRDLYDVLLQSFGARSQPMMWGITTKGTIRESIADDLYEYATNVLNGTYPRDFSRLFFIYELDDVKEVHDKSMWRKANPGLGTIKSYKFMNDMYETALKDDKFMPTFLTKDLNVIENTAGSWLNYETIVNLDTYDYDTLRDSYCIGGVDLSSTTDLACATQLFMKPGHVKNINGVDMPIVYALQHYFLPEGLKEKKVKEDKIPYDVWEKRGLITFTPGSVIDYRYITKWFVDRMEIDGMRPLWIGYDRWSATYWVQEMKDCGFVLEEVIQGSKTFSTPMKTMEGWLRDNLINYNNNPILKWCLTNTSVKRDDNDNIQPTKKTNQKLRIDGTVSLLDAVVVLLKHLQDYMNMI